MRFHTYGPVEIAIAEEPLPPDGEHAEPSAFARMVGDETLFRHLETSELVRDDEIQEWVPAWGWMLVDDGQFLEHGDGRIELFDAGATLCWHEWERWQEAERAMGDPNP